MMFPTTVIGTDLYCPDCGRLLVHVHEEGGYTLAENAAVTMSGIAGEPPVLQQATCLKCEAPAGLGQKPSRLEWAQVYGRALFHAARDSFAVVGFAATLIALTDWIAR